MMDQTPMAMLAAHQHELFMTYREAGFTEDQALKLLAYWAAAQAANDEGDQE
jgi:hypothetical protein